MDERLIAFIAALRAAGVRISVAESADALRAVEQAGIGEREIFRAALQASLIKDSRDGSTFRELFPLYFGGTGADLAQAEDLSEAELQLVEQVLRQLAEVQPAQLGDLLEAMVTGRPLTQIQLAALIARASPMGMSHPYFQKWMARRVLRELQFEQLELLLRDLLGRLREQGLGEEALTAAEASARANMTALAEQIERAVGQDMMRRAAADRPRTRPADELVDRRFDALNLEERERMREMVTKLAARLRTRAALRQRRGRRGALDAKGTLRASLQYGAVPIVLRRRRRHLKPRLVVICDLSNSMRSLASFTLLLVYALQDQISRTRCFAFIDDLTDISSDFAEARPRQAIERIMTRVRADYAHTDLGSSLRTFEREHMRSVDRRTTVLIIGDGRNNFHDPGLPALALIKARARHLLWFNPESRRAWQNGDSDMEKYAPLCDAVHHVANLRELGEAVDHLVRIW